MRWYETDLAMLRCVRLGDQFYCLHLRFIGSQLGMSVINKLVIDADFSKPIKNQKEKNCAALNPFHNLFIISRIAMSDDLCLFNDSSPRSETNDEIKCN